MKTTTIRLSGLCAISYAEVYGATLCSYDDPTEKGREDLTVAEARAIAREDASLVYVDMELSDSMIESLATAAGAAGDEAQVELCDAALADNEAALVACANVIVDAASNAADKRSQRGV